MAERPGFVPAADEAVLDEVMDAVELAERAGATRVESGPMYPRRRGVPIRWWATAHRGGRVGVEDCASRVEAITALTTRLTRRRQGVAGG